MIHFIFETVPAGYHVTWKTENRDDWPKGLTFIKGLPDRKFNPDLKVWFIPAVGINEAIPQLEQWLDAEGNVTWEIKPATMKTEPSADLP